MSIRHTRKQWSDLNGKSEPRKTKAERKAESNRTTRVTKAPRKVRLRELVQAVENRWPGHEHIQDARVLDAVARRAKSNE